MIEDVRAKWGDSNWLGLWTLYRREVQRFLKVYTQTLLAPLVTSLLFLAVFTLALGDTIRMVGQVPFIQFLAPGLIMMAITQNSFANNSSSICISKIQGSIIDILMPPFTAHELTFAISMGGVTRGVLVGSLMTVIMSFFVPFSIHNIGFVLYYGFMAALMLSLLGVMTGIWSERYDHIAAVADFVVTPLAFLSGTFYSIQRLPEAVQTVALFNPFFYVIDGFRYGFIGHSDGNPLIGLVVVLGINVVLWTCCHRMFKTGYKLKA